MLALKLLLVPSFLALLSLAGRRWGPSVAGWLAGLPLVGGPILFFLAVERGAQFGSEAAVASVSAVFASLSFNTAYAWTSLRLRWPGALAAAMAAWWAAAFALAALPSSVWVASAGGLRRPHRRAAAAAAGPASFPRCGRCPGVDLAARMAAGVALTLLVTAAAPQIGPTWSGLAGGIPGARPRALGVLARRQWRRVYRRAAPRAGARNVELRGVLLVPRADASASTASPRPSVFRLRSP